MRTLQCLHLVIICLLGYSDSFLSTDTGSMQALRHFEVVNETTFELCQNVLRQVISRLTNSEALLEVLREKESRGNDWMTGGNAMSGKNWCRDKDSPTVYISWSHEAKTCMNLRVFDKTGEWNIMKHICEDYTNHPSIYGEAESIKPRTKRESETESKYGFVNIAKEWKKKPCSELLLEVYMNEELLFSNVSIGGQAGDNATVEQIKVHINANLTDHQPKPRKRYTFVHDPVSFSTAKQDCVDQNMRLLTVKDADENRDIMEAMKTEAHDIYWTSGNKLANHKTWRWADGEKFKYVGWTEEEPTNEQGNEYCLEIWKTGIWNDNVCEVKLPYICEAFEMPKDIMMPTMEIFVDGKLEYGNVSTSGDNMVQPPTISVHIGLDGTNNSDHSTIVLFQRKLLSKDSVEVEENSVIPNGFIPENSNGIYFTVEMIMEKDFICPKIYCIPSKLKLNYSDAMEYCQNHSMQLVSIEDEKEHLVVEEKAKKDNPDHYFWTSGYLNDGVWYWNENEKITYDKWRIGQPDNTGGTEKCIELYFPYNKYEARWNDQECSDTNPFICESLD